MLPGVSVYCGLEDYSLDKTLKYLDMAKSKGCEIVFSSAHINEASYVIDEFQSVVNHCIDLGLKLSLDISKPTYEKINLPEGIYSLRLDYGFNDEDILEFSKSAPFMVELNASTITNAHLEKLLNDGVNPSRIILSFNFYPKKYTGHDYDFVFERTKWFKEKGFTVYAFIPSHVGFRPPLYEGLPTVEDHRYKDILSCINELKVCGVDGITFGDAYASEEEVELLCGQACPELNIKATLIDGYEYLYDHVYSFRCDSPSWMGRLGGTRTLDSIAPVNTTVRKVGDITVDNEGFKRYKGEVNIIFNELEKDERVNVVGHIFTTDRVMKYMSKTKIKFIK